MPNQLPLKPLYRELGFIFNEALLREAVRAFRDTYEESNGLDFTIEAMRDHESGAMKKMAKDFLDYAEFHHHLYDSPVLTLWQKPLSCGIPNGNATIMTPEQADRYARPTVMMLENSDIE